MKKIKCALPAFFLLMISSCVSILSKVSDEQAWMEYFNENSETNETSQRSIASSNGASGDGLSSSGPSIRILRSILQALPFRDYLIQSDHRDAYQAKLVLAYDQAYLRVKSQGIELTKNDYSTEQKQFLDRYSYEKMLVLVDGFHKMFLSGVELRAAKRSMELASGCETQKSEDSKPNLSQFYPFPGGLTYLPREVYFCINERWMSEMDQIMNETTERLGIEIKTNDAREWILHRQIQPIYQKTLAEYFLKKEKDEELIWQDQWNDLRSSIDWNHSAKEILDREIPRLRKTYRFLNLEARLSEEAKSRK